MAVQFLPDTKAMDGPADASSEFRDSAVASPFRSTVPVLDLAKDDWSFEQQMGDGGDA